MDWGCAYEESISKDVKCIRSSGIRFEVVYYVWSGYQIVVGDWKMSRLGKLVDRKVVLRERLDNSGFKTV
jgi:hypothetical protein